MNRLRRFCLLIVLLLAAGCTARGPELPPSSPTPGVTTTARLELSPNASATPYLTALPTDPPPSPTPMPEPTPLPTAFPISFELLNQRGGQSLSLAVAGDVAYLGVGPRLVTLDLANTADPEYLGQSEMLLGVVRALLVRDEVAYVATGSELMLFDVADPANPSLLSFYLVPAEILLRHGNTLVVAGESSLATWDISRPERPVSLAEVTLPIEVDALAQVGDLLLVASAASGEVYAVDNSAPSAPGDPYVLLTTAGSTVSSLAVTGDSLYVGGQFSLERWDLSNPAAPVRNWQPANVFGVVNNILLQGDQAFLSTGYGDVGIYLTNIITVQLPEPAVETATVVSSPLSATGDGVLVADGGLTIYRQDGDGGLETVGHYLSFPRVGDVALAGTAGIFVDSGSLSTGGQSGLYTISLPQLEIQGQYADDPLCEGCRSSLLNVVVSDTLAYVGAWEDGLRVLELEDPKAPRLLHAIGGFWITEELALGNAYGVAPTFLGRGNPELAFFDLRKPAAVSSPTPLEFGEQVTAAAVVGSKIMAATSEDTGNYLRLANLPFGEEVPRPETVKTLNTGERVNDIQALGDLAAAATDAGITIFSLAEQEVVAKVPLDGGTHSVALVGDLALVTSTGRSGRGTLFAFDLTDPYAPQQAGRVPLPDGPAEIAAMDDTLLLGSEEMGLILLQIIR